MNRIYECIENAAVYLAERSVEKSIPIVSHKVCKPDNLKKMLEEIRLRQSED